MATKTARKTVNLSESARQDAFIKFWSMNRTLSFGDVLKMFEKEYGPGPYAR